MVRTFSSKFGIWFLLDMQHFKCVDQIDFKLFGGRKWLEMVRVMIYLHCENLAGALPYFLYYNILYATYLLLIDTLLQNLLGNNYFRREKP